MDCGYGSSGRIYTLHVGCPMFKPWYDLVPQAPLGEGHNSALSSTKCRPLNNNDKNKVKNN